MGEIDESFIQSIEHRPKSISVEAEGIPVIDLSALNSQDLVVQVGDACKNWGFFQVINHWVPSSCREKVELASRAFFRQPSEEKRKVRRDEANPMGFYDTEHTKNVRDWKQVFDFTVENPTVVPASHEPDDPELQEIVNQWPGYPPNFREACEEYAREIEKLAYKLLELISLSLGLPAEKFNGFFKNQTSFMRLNSYPICPIPHLALGVGRHKDSGALTVLAQDDVGGLEVKRKSDEEWVQVWSNDKYESVEHRVTVNSERERFSIPFFFNPSHNVMVEPLKELTTKQNPARYKPYNWGKFHTTRNISNFKKLNVENIQIYHFRI
ncbi:2-oxoglutarate (2OG) and Fe(II)-dependent oxygenase superfamily protein [Abeliophyllum distichum]|uniref:2-oxoglutarate (2OG) and Fe(II)-dependent oxygenase superfamily protein n=1 Tax=Abeliophyllum distichum TaxID=126358 RepID=A0ABD1NWP4_9LAMI